MKNDEQLRVSYEQANEVKKELNELGFSEEQIDKVIQSYNIEDLYMTINILRDNGLEPEIINSMIMNEIKPNSKKLTIEDIIDEEATEYGMQPDEEAVNDLVTNGDLYAPNLDTDKNINVNEPIHQEQLDLKQSALEKFNKEKSTSSLTQLVYEAINPKSLSTINLKSPADKEKPGVVNQNVTFDWVEKGEYLSVEDLKDSLMKFYKEHKKDKYEILMPDGKTVKYKISKQNIKQISKKLKETTQIILDQKAEKTKTVDVNISSLDKELKGTLHTGLIHMNLGRKNVPNDISLSEGKYVPKETVVESLSGIFRRTTPWGAIKAALTNLEKEHSMLDQAIEGSRGK